VFPILNIKSNTKNIVVDGEGSHRCSVEAHRIGRDGGAAVGVDGVAYEQHNTIKVIDAI
jgi:hypothetical protein